MNKKKKSGPSDGARACVPTHVKREGSRENEWANNSSRDKLRTTQCNFAIL